MRSRSLQFILVFLSLVSSCRPQTSLNIYVTTDLHGMLLPFDNTQGEATDRSLANLASVVRHGASSNIILLDNGDILQGDPLAYYYNYIDTTRTHVVADILNYLSYDAAVAGNHDIEAGHAVYDRVRRQYSFPLLAANAVDEFTGKPYFEPYTLIHRGGYRVVVFGLITPSVPRWLPESLYRGIRFDDMVETARKWMPVMMAEKPDLMVGLFHSGLGDVNEAGNDENNTLAVAMNVPGFDVIFCGHDHNQAVKEVVNAAGKKVLILDGGSRAEALMHAAVIFNGGRSDTDEKEITGRIIEMNTIPASKAFIKKYKDVSDTLKEYTAEVIGMSVATATTRDAYFGPSAFVDLIHRIQLDITGAQISLAAPLSFDEKIGEGKIRIRDMFRLYRFENLLYTVSMSGEEIDRHLEHSCSLWFETMDSKDDFLIKYRRDDEGKPVIINGRLRLRSPSYNFDSAMGIRYQVDVSKPEGSRVMISSLSDGTPFSYNSTYTVAVNSYRASGGGGHFPAAGIDNKKLRSRLISSTDRDLRYYMTEWIRQKKEIHPVPLSEWEIVPREWVSLAADREMDMLFGN